MPAKTMSPRAAFLFAACALILGAIGWLVLRPAPPTPAAADSAATSAEPSAAMRTELPVSVAATEPQAQTAAERADAPRMPAVIQPTSRPAATAAAPTIALPEASPQARQLVAGLTSLDVNQGPITKEQAEQWKQGLQGLIAQGNAAVPAIREFLERNFELNFAAVPGGEQLGQSSLRAAMINALSQIGGPEAQALMAQTLQTATLPSEVALLTQYLEQQAPGQYRQEALNAVNEILGMSEKGQLPSDWDLGALFQVLQKFGDSASASVLEGLEGQWKYYATMSLAQLDGGAGIPALVRETQDVSAGGRRDFAFQMLAQAAAQSPDASSALLEEARANQIPDAAWRKIAIGLAGDQYLLGSPPAAAASSGTPDPSLKTYHIANGNQNFYSLPVGADAGISQRSALISQLLSATSNPAAVAALQSARDTLSTVSAGK